MARTTINGISIHPMINDWPAALLPASALCDVMALVTGRHSWSQCAYHTLQLGTLTGLGAAAAGLMDYQDVPAHPDAKRAGQGHLVLNAAALAMSALNLATRDPRRPRAGLMGMALSLMTLAALGYSAVQGAVLAYKYGMAVPPRQAAQPARMPAEAARAAS